MKITPSNVAREAFEHATSPNFIRSLGAGDQAQLARWQHENFGPQPAYRMVLGAIEELGELAHAMLKHEQGIRGMEDEAAYLDAAGDAIADTVVYLMQLCTKLRLDFPTLVRHTIYDVVTKRDWKKTDAGTQPAEKAIHDA